MCPKKEVALASNEFISKFKIRADQNSQTAEDHERLEEQMEAANLSDGLDESPNGQMWSACWWLGGKLFQIYKIRNDKKREKKEKLFANSIAFIRWNTHTEMEGEDDEHSNAGFNENTFD